MTRRTWIGLIAGGFGALAGTALFADDEHGHGHGQGHGRHENEGEDERHRYSDHDRDEVRGWYHEHYEGLPPGLAKRDELPPGLERQLRLRGTLPPGLQRRVRPCPVELERRLPPPPPNCAHVILGGHIVLVNRRTWMVLDIIHLER